MPAFILEKCTKIGLMNNTCASGEKSNAPLYTGIGSEEAVNTILTAMVISTSFVAV